MCVQGCFFFFLNHARLWRNTQLLSLYREFGLIKSVLTNRTHYQLWGNPRVRSKGQYLSDLLRFLWHRFDRPLVSGFGLERLQFDPKFGQSRGFTNSTEAVAVERVLQAKVLINTDAAKKPPRSPLELNHLIFLCSRDGHTLDN